MNIRVIARCLDTRTERYGFVSPDTRLMIAISNPNHVTGLAGYHIDVYERHPSSIHLIAQGCTLMINNHLNADVHLINRADESTYHGSKLLSLSLDMASHCFQPYLDNL